MRFSLSVIKPDKAASKWPVKRVTRFAMIWAFVETNAFKFCWIVDFPMYEMNEKTGAIDFAHNPFSMPQGGLDALNTQDPLHVKAYQYDCCLQRI
jgi:aspartyl-tRNA synthetase